MLGIQPGGSAGLADEGRSRLPTTAWCCHDQVDGSGGSFRIGQVSHLFNIRGQRPGRVYDVSGDGQTFLVNASTSDVRVPTATLVINWDAEIERR